MYCIVIMDQYACGFTFLCLHCFIIGVKGLYNYNIHQALLLKTPEFKQFLGTNFHLIANNFSVIFRKQNSVMIHNTKKIYHNYHS